MVITSTIAIAANIIHYSPFAQHCFSIILPTHHYLDLLAPTISSMSLLNATSVTISWTQPVGGLTVDIYRVTLTEMCSGFNHTKDTTTSTSIVIDGLQENSSYTVNIFAMNNQSNAINTTSGLTITTLETGMFT